MAEGITFDSNSIPYTAIRGGGLSIDIAICRPGWSDCEANQTPALPFPGSSNSVVLVAGLGEPSPGNAISFGSAQPQRLNAAKTWTVGRSTKNWNHRTESNVCVTFTALPYVTQAFLPAMAGRQLRT